MSKQRLELTWIGKENRPNLEPRILLEDVERSYHAAHRVTEKDRFDNMLIHGDNLLALKALEQEFTGKVKCIYIDPPYNTGSAFEHYDDGVEHSIWLSLMRDRIEILRNLLSEDGSLWVNLDDNEAHYFKVMCDEVFGRKNFVSTVVWEKKYSPQNDARWLSDSHDLILTYAKNKEIWRPFLLPRTDEMNSRYSNRDNDPRGPWKAADFSVKTYNASCDYPITLPSGRIVTPPTSRAWVTSKEKFETLIADNRIWFGESGNNVPAQKKFLSEVKDGVVSKTIWFRTEVGDNQEAKKEIKTLLGNDVFTTPKPERLVEKILLLGSQKGDLVLDSFLGSGTTAAVAHKMGRRWIGIELGDHCYSHCATRLQKVIDGDDQGGISKAFNWQGGGGFRFYELGPSLIKHDQWGNAVINKAFNAEMLAMSLCKLSGFTYAPDPDIYWMQGHGSETDYIYGTTRFLGEAELRALNEEVGSERSLLVYCSAFQLPEGGLEALDRLTIKKIPQSVLDSCEWDKDDYSLKIQNLPQADLPQISASTAAPTSGKKSAKKPKKAGQATLFDLVDSSEDA